jgi:hypothetical protein
MNSMETVTVYEVRYTDSAGKDRCRCVRPTLEEARKSLTVGRKTLMWLNQQGISNVRIVRATTSREFVEAGLIQDRPAPVGADITA